MHRGESASLIPVDLQTTHGDLARPLLPDALRTPDGDHRTNRAAHANLGVQSSIRILMRSHDTRRLRPDALGRNSLTTSRLSSVHGSVAAHTFS
ncbi:unnamed protein product [Mycena citricolor]|uniref:Uncharacterized protein n=1 Tax=Mycena citricolor TaxID=2018698 RepID=A0AAD2H0Y4_9AGAR|nr:unnamed protein product [Mycena citricolor]